MVPKVIFVPPVRDRTPEVVPCEFPERSVYGNNPKINAMDDATYYKWVQAMRQRRKRMLGSDYVKK